MKKTIATLMGAIAITGGATYGAVSSELVDVKNEKHAILQDNIWKSVRLGETPVWDISVVSQGEMTKAYTDLANQKNAKEKANLFDGLRDKATAEGVICKI